MPDAVAMERRPASAGVALAMLGLGTFAIGTDSHIVIGVLDKVAAGLGVGGPQAGQLVTLFSVSYALFAPVCGWLFSGLDRRHAILVASFVFVVGNLVCALAGSYAVMAAGRVLAAFGAGMYVPLAFAIATSLVPPERRGVALPVGTYAGQYVDWHYIFFAVAALGAMKFAMLAAFLPSLPALASTTLRERLAPAASPKVLTALSTTFIVVLSEYTLYSYISIVFAQGRAAILPAVLLAFGIGAFLGNLGVGFATDRFGPRRILIAAVAVQTALLPSVVLARDIPSVAITLAAAWGVVSYMYLVPIQHRLVELSKEAGPMTLSLNSSAIYLGIAGGGALGGLVLAVFGVGSLAASATLLGLLALAIIWRSF